MASDQEMLSTDALHQHNERFRRRSRIQAPHPETIQEGSHHGSTGPAIIERESAGTQKTESGAPGLRSITMMKRKISQWKGRQGSTSLGSRRSQLRPHVALENTYKMAPDPENKFSVPRVREVTEDAIKFLLAKQSNYNPAKATQVSRLLADDIKGRVKQLGYSRYKFVVLVHIGETNGQSLAVASRAVWDTNSDNVVTVHHRYGNMYVVANVYGTYYE